MVEVLKSGYWSKSETFLLPLTGLSRTHKYPIKSYLFWDKYSIEDYNLILKIEYQDYDTFLAYCRKIIFPILDRSNMLVECHDFEGFSVLIVDLSEWAFDIELFLKGRYSKMSGDAKDIISEYHTYYEKQIPRVHVNIAGIIDPDVSFTVLDNMTPFEYVAEHYGFDLDELKKVGELAAKYDEEKETLSIQMVIKE